VDGMGTRLGGDAGGDPGRARDGRVGAAVNTCESPVPSACGDGLKASRENGFVIHREPEAMPAARLFDLLWESLADVLGTAASATLLRRAIKQAASRASWSEPISVTKNGLDYEYRLPETWTQAGSEEALGALRVVAAELRVLLVELTGPVVVRRLARLEPLRERGIDFSAELPK
jgi:hypothetical protein